MEGAAAGQTIRCHTCGKDVESVRSVMIRPHGGPDALWELFKRYSQPNELSEPDRRKYRWLYVRAVEAGKYHRAFICNTCYQAFDTHCGVGGIETDAGNAEFGLAGQSRGGKAAVYDYGKWVSFQKRLAKQMGGELVAGVLNQ
jgi:hypothetical protein